LNTKSAIIVVGPIASLDFGTQVHSPSFAALASTSAFDLGSDICPIWVFYARDEGDQKLILLCGELVFRSDSFAGRTNKARAQVVS
jgi:hypothetical protein